MVFPSPLPPTLLISMVEGPLHDGTGSRRAQAHPGCCRCSAWRTLPARVDLVRPREALQRDTERGGGIHYQRNRSWRFLLSRGGGCLWVGWIGWGVRRNVGGGGRPILNPGHCSHRPGLKMDAGTGRPTSRWRGSPGWSAKAEQGGPRVKKKCCPSTFRFKATRKLGQKVDVAWQKQVCVGERN